MERGRRIELLALAWKAKVLPLYEPRSEKGGALGQTRTDTPLRASEPKSGAATNYATRAWKFLAEEEGVEPSHVGIKTRCRNHLATPLNIWPLWHLSKDALPTICPDARSTAEQRDMWYRIGDSNPSVQSESLLTSPEVECGTLYLASQEGIEPSTHGFGDRYSAS